MNKFAIFLTVFVIIISIIGCSSNNENEIRTENEVSTDTETLAKNDVANENIYEEEQIIKFSNTDISINDKLVLSPLNDAKIWALIQNDISYEIDKESGEWQTLDSLLGNGFSLGLTRFYKDNINKNLAWIRYRQGVMLYNISSDTKKIYNKVEYFKNHLITTIVPSDSVVWIGTSGGVYYFHRKDETINDIDQFRDIWVQSIYVEEDKLRINGNYLYYLNSDSLHDINSSNNFDKEIVGVFLVTDDYKVLRASLNYKESVIIIDENDSVVAKLDDIPIKAAFVDKDNELWFYNRRFVKYDIRDKKVLASYPVDHSGLDLYEWDEYFYFNTSRGFGRLNKFNGEFSINSDFLIKSIIADDEHFWILSDSGVTKIDKALIGNNFVPLSEVIERENNILSLGRKAQSENILERIKYTAEFYSVYGKNRNKIRGFSSHVSAYFGFRQLKTGKAEDIDLIREFINNDAEGLEIEISYYILSTSPITVGNPTLAMSYYNKFSQEYPQSEFLNWISDESLRIMGDSAKQFDEINKMDISDDEKLWFLGNLFMVTLKVDWNVSEVGWDLGYPHSIFNELIAQYPTSQWADNAEYEILRYYGSTAHEGGFVDREGLRSINRYEIFMEKYPDSEFISYAKSAIAGNYYSLARNKHYDVLKDFADKAISLYNDVVSSSPGTQYETKAIQQISNIEEFLNNYSLKLELSIENNEFFNEDSVFVTFNLTNMNNLEREISINQDLPNFSIYIRRYDIGNNSQFYNLQFTRNLTMEVNAKQKMVIGKNGGEYLEEHNLQKLTLYRSGFQKRPEYGKYIIDKEGLYILRGYFYDYDQGITIFSDEISFTVNKK